MVFANSPFDLDGMARAGCLSIVLRQASVDLRPEPDTGCDKSVSVKGIKHRL